LRLHVTSLLAPL